jgi:three-Cys-motif partner protein
MPTQRGPQSTAWEMQPHTLAKHRLIERYLGGWFPILGGAHGRIVFLDGFAGPGIYSKGEEGSPIIALRTLLKHPRLERLGQVHFVFMEPEEDRAGSLNEQLDTFVKAHGGLPKNVTYALHQVTFEQGATGILDTLEQQKATLAPTFAFIDPFGVSGVPMELIGRLLSFERCEVFFNFMGDTVNRFCTAGNIDVHLDALFGCDDYKQVSGNPTQRQVFLHDLYERQLGSHCNFKYIQQFEMINMAGHNIYSLFFGTRHLAGLRVMKDAMWKVDPGGGNRFSDRLAGQQVLFGAEPGIRPLRQELLRHFAGRTVDVADINEHTLVHTPYSASHWKSLVLKPLEKEGVISVVTSPRLRSGAFPDGTKVAFPG